MKSEMSSRGVLKAEELDCIAYMSVGEEEGGGGCEWEVRLRRQILI